METVVIVVHLMVVVALIATILLQRSEGGALGIGGGGGGGLFTSRGSANLLTRTTTILAVVFFATSIGLTLIARQQANAPSILDSGAAPAGPAVPLGDDATRGAGQGILDTLQQRAPSPDSGAPQPPTGGADGASAPAPAAPQVPVAQ